LIDAPLARSQSRVNGETSAFDDLCAAVLRGESGAWPSHWRSVDTLAAIGRRLHFHGIAGLLHESGPLLVDWPEEMLALIRKERLARAMWEMRHKLLVAEVIEALFTETVRSVVLKGTAYAYSLYSTPALRLRGDTDLLIAEADLTLARKALAQLGWIRPFGKPGRFGPMHYQELWQYHDPNGFTHDIDLHWEVTNSRALRHVLDAQRLIGRAHRLPRLSPNALCADPITALTHRAINRAVHAQSGYYSLDCNEYDPNRLLWAVDLDLLARQLPPKSWQTLANRALVRGIAPVVHDALVFAKARLETPVPGAILKALKQAPSDTPAMRYLTSTDDLTRALADFRATQGFAARAKFVLARALPSAGHIRAKYPEQGSVPLWRLYARRLKEPSAYMLNRNRA
jgi:hypothetical protein